VEESILSRSLSLREVAQIERVRATLPDWTPSTRTSTNGHASVARLAFVLA
jgi:hypothetical protein